MRMIINPERGNGVKYFVVGTVFLILSAMCAQARDLPQYDSASYCKTVNSILTSLLPAMKDDLIKSCMEKEQQMPAQIERIIPYVDDATIKGCGDMARALAGGSYQGFAGCLMLSITQRILDGKLELSFPKQ